MRPTTHAKTGSAMTWLLMIVLFAGCDATGSAGDDDTPRDPESVAKTNEMQIYMHYMPWFHSKEESGYWGSHWRMETRDPDKIGEDGQREIASHYYPLIGPYDSQDEAVIEYHLLLMKYAGVDAVLLDWYGTHKVYDYRPNLQNANAFIDRVDDAGLDFGIVYEEYTAGSVADQTAMTAIEAAQADVTYMEKNYFSRSDYMRVQDQPLLLTFGPRYFQEESQWNQIFEPLDEKLKFLPLWQHDHLVGDNADGEFSWIDFTTSLDDLGRFYGRRASLDVLVGSAYPRFHDYYEEGGTGESYGRVRSNDGATFRKTLELAQENGLDRVQIATWNDFGEGTVVEPTAEDQFQFLEILQDFTGVPYGRSELELIHRYYNMKKEYGEDARKNELLREAFGYLVALKLEKARNALDKISG